MLVTFVKCASKTALRGVRVEPHQSFDGSRSLRWGESSRLGGTWQPQAIHAS